MVAADPQRARPARLARLRRGDAPVGARGCCGPGPRRSGVWLRLGDDATRFERMSISVALAGHGAWFVLLLAAAVGIAYGAPTAVASTAAALGTMLVGFALIP